MAVLAVALAIVFAHSPQPTRAADEQSPAQPADLAAVLRPILEKHPQLPGLIGAIVDGNRITAIGAAGIRKVGSPEKMTTSDLIHLGSDTKAMTATLIGRLFESHQLAPSDTLADVFPEFRATSNAEQAKATVAQLLEHTAGVPRNVEWATYNRLRASLGEQRRYVVRDVLGKAHENPPGTKYEYSNVGFVILGAILEEKTGQAWEDLIEQQLFKPLGMTTAGFGPPGTPGQVDQPWGHALKDGELLPRQTDNPPLMDPAGRVHCSITDWAKFVNVYLDPPQPPVVILKPDTIRLLTTPGPVGTYAGGWINAQRSWGGGPVLNHAGSNLMWYCDAWLAPKRHFAVLAATNVGHDEAIKATDEAAGAMIKFHAAHKGKP
jgi:CubicO group peptidase (beta-lactamase class C family)